MGTKNYPELLEQNRKPYSEILKSKILRAPIKLSYHFLETCLFTEENIPYITYGIRIEQFANGKKTEETFIDIIADKDAGEAFFNSVVANFLTPKFLIDIATKFIDDTSKVLPN